MPSFGVREESLWGGHPGWVLFHHPCGGGWLEVPPDAHPCPSMSPVRREVKRGTASDPPHFSVPHTRQGVAASAMSAVIMVSMPYARQRLEQTDAVARVVIPFPRDGTGNSLMCLKPSRPMPPCDGRKTAVETGKALRWRSHGEDGQRRRRKEPRYSKQRGGK